MKTIFSILDKRSFSLIWWMSLLLIVIIAGADIATGSIIFSGPIFILPILLVSWYGSKRSGVLLAFFSTAVWVIPRILIHTDNFRPEQIMFEGISYMAAYSFVAVLITNFRSVYRVETVAADTDNLTGLLSPRGFYSEFANELLRSIRYEHIFSLAYLDIDNFKNINDSLGHSIGDKLLVDVAKCLKSSLRTTDKVARLGGDEFVCLLPETESEAAKTAFLKVTELLSNSMKSNKWPVSFSVGVVTFETPPDDIKKAIKIADDLMYNVKKGKKDNIAYKIWHENAF